MDVLIGAAIAIISGSVVQFLNNIQDLKKDRKKLVFEKIQDIIETISKVSDGIQKDMAMVLGVGNPNDISENLSFEITKLNCLVKIYHPKLSDEINKLVLSTDNYFNSKVNFVNAKNRKETDENIKQNLQTIIDKFELCVTEIKTFVNSLENYGSSKTV